MDTTSTWLNEANSSSTISVRLRSADSNKLHEITIPRLIDSVTLIRELGRGAMGVVYLGYDRLLQREVAVKFMSEMPHNRGFDELDQFLEGARAAAQIRHPNLVFIHKAALAVDEICYVVMDYINGINLQSLLENTGSLSLPVVLTIMNGVCSGVAVLHKHGSVHRDLKPANILVGREGHVFVTDFGLTRRNLSSGRKLDRRCGTPVYMAPETFDCKFSALTDIYALAIITYQLLTGELPFRGDLNAMMNAHRNIALPMQTLLDRDVPIEVIDVIERASHKRAFFRYRSVGDFKFALMAAGASNGMFPTESDILAEFVDKTVSAPTGTSGESNDAGHAIESSKTIHELAEEKRLARRFQHDAGSEADSNSVTNGDQVNIRIPFGLSRQFPELLLYDNFEDRCEALRTVTNLPRAWFWHTVLPLTRLSTLKSITFAEWVGYAGFCVWLSVLEVILGIKNKIPGFVAGCIYVAALVFLVLIRSALLLVMKPNAIRQKLRKQLVNAGKLICIECGYDLRGQTEARCSECGTSLSWYIFTLLETADGIATVLHEVIGPTSEFAVSVANSTKFGDGANAKASTRLKVLRVAKAPDKSMAGLARTTTAQSEEPLTARTMSTPSSEVCLRRQELNSTESQDIHIAPSLRWRYTELANLKSMRTRKEALGHIKSLEKQRVMIISTLVLFLFLIGAFILANPSKPLIGPIGWSVIGLTTAIEIAVISSYLTRGGRQWLRSRAADEQLLSSHS